MFQKQKQQKYLNKGKSSVKKTAFLSKRRTEADTGKADDLRKHLWATQSGTPRGSKKHKDLEMDVTKSKQQSSRDPDKEAQYRERVGDRDQPQLQGSYLQGERQGEAMGKREAEGQSLRA